MGGHEGYITAGMYDDGTVCEIFLTTFGKGSTRRCEGISPFARRASRWPCSTACRFETLVRKFSYMRFEPEGITENPQIRFAKSMPALHHAVARLPVPGHGLPGGARDPDARGPGPTAAAAPAVTSSAATVDEARRPRLHLGPACGQCGGMMQRTGSCNVQQLRQQHRLRLIQRLRFSRAVRDHPADGTRPAVPSAGDRRLPTRWRPPARSRRRARRRGWWPCERRPRRTVRATFPGFDHRKRRARDDGRRTARTLQALRGSAAEGSGRARRGATPSQRAARRNGAPSRAGRPDPRTGSEGVGRAAGPIWAYRRPRECAVRWSTTNRPVQNLSTSARASS